MQPWLLVRAASWSRSVSVRTSGILTLRSLILFAKYCGPDCQKAHWSKHQHDCRSLLAKPTWQPSWIVEDRTPAFVAEGTFDYVPFGEGKDLWGNVPAVDILHLQGNEGLGYDEDCRLLFAGTCTIVGPNQG